MSVRQRIFSAGTLFALFAWQPIASAGLEKRIEIAEGRISVVLPDGWKETDLNAKDTLVGFATPDNATSAFFTEIDPSAGGSMQELLDNTIRNFEERFEITGEQKPRTGQVEGPEKKWPAIFTTVDAVFDRGDKEFEMRFYLLVFDTGSSLFFLQASTTRPVRSARERQIYDFIRSIVAKS